MSLRAKYTAHPAHYRPQTEKKLPRSHVPQALIAALKLSLAKHHGLSLSRPTRNTKRLSTLGG